MTAKTTLGLWIDGDDRPASTSETFSSINPADGSIVCQVGLAGAEDVHVATKSAVRGTQIWRETSLAERS